MTVGFHYPIPRSAPAIPAAMNIPLGQLDAGIGNMLGGGAGYPFQRDLLTTNGAKTLSSDTLDVANLSFVTVSAETGTADNLKTLVNPVAGATYILQAHAGHVITVKNGTGNIFLNAGADVVLSGNIQLALFYSPLGVATDLFIPPNVPSSGGAIFSARAVVGSPVASITISSIPATAQHLLLVTELRSSSPGLNNFLLSFNGDTTAANYYLQFTSLGGTLLSSQEQLGVSSGLTIQPSLVGSTGIAGNGFAYIWILNYLSTTLPRVALWQCGNHATLGSGAFQMAYGGGDWRNAANAITSLTITQAIAANSAYALYGFN